MPKKDDRPGDVFGVRQLIQRVGEITGSTYRQKWRWRCTKCGHEDVARWISIMKSVICPNCQARASELRERGSDLTGLMFGARTIIGPAPSRPGMRMWTWRCTCGREGVSDLKSLRGSRNCVACTTKYKEAELTGTRIGTFTILGLGEPAKNGLRRWRWRCDCGKEGSTNIHNLMKLRSHRHQHSRPFQPAHVGDRLGRRTLIESLNDPSAKSDGRWRWRCDCGKEGVGKLGGLRTSKGECQSCSRAVFPEDLTGRRFGSIVITGRTIKQKQTWWTWVCDCGTVGSSVGWRLQKLRRCKRCRGSTEALGKRIGIRELAFILNVNTRRIEKLVEEGSDFEEILQKLRRRASAKRPPGGKP